MTNEYADNITPSSSSIWIEKYRPKTLEDVLGNDEVIKRLKVVAKEGNMPNLLMAGPPGTGKTSSILCLCRTMLGSKYKRYVMELNASDDRGIDVVRERIKNFAKEMASLPTGRHKIVILDEVDSMTEAAQQSLRRIMEQYSDTTRFALACNQSTKVLEPIQSRCAIIRFAKLTDEQMLRKLVQVCIAEGVTYEDDGLEALVFVADGDMRSLINNLQATVSGFQIANKENVLKVCDIPPPEKVKAAVHHCLRGSWREAHDTVQDLIDSGYTPLGIVGTVRNVLRRYDAPEHIVLEYIKATGHAHMVMSGGLATMLQLDKLIANLCKIAIQLKSN